MTNFKVATLLLVSFFACHASALAQDAMDAVRKLEAEKKGIGWRVRHIVSETKIHYDAEGKLIGKATRHLRGYRNTWRLICLSTDSSSELDPRPYISYLAVRKEGRY